MFKSSLPTFDSNISANCSIISPLSIAKIFKGGPQERCPKDTSGNVGVNEVKTQFQATINKEILYHLSF